MTSTPRYAVYYAPAEGSALDAFGIDWLGRTAVNPAGTGGVPDGFGEEEYRRLVEAPRHYGFHATLKAPFELAEGIDVHMLQSRLKAVACSMQAFRLPPLRVAYINRFLALVPACTEPLLQRLHAACLRDIDDCRAPLTPYDKARHEKKHLTERQTRLLGRFGYPFVLEEYRFHMTLTGDLDERQRRSVRERLEALVAPALTDPVEVNEVCLFMQPQRTSPFRLAGRFPLGGEA